MISHSLTTGTHEQKNDGKGYDFFKVLAHPNFQRWFHLKYDGHYIEIVMACESRAESKHDLLTTSWAMG